MNTTFRLTVPFRFIQNLRLAHALLELDYRVFVSAEEAPKFVQLRKVFGVRPEIGGEKHPVLEPIEIRHKGLPSVRFGSIERPLIFPQGVFDRCRGLWRPERQYRYGFAGLMSDDRRDVLTRWMGKWFPGASPVIPPAAEPRDGILRRIARRITGATAGERRDFLPEAETVVWQSFRGRNFPGKAWDDHYFRLLGDLEFALCPNGNSVWTYRFFEAVMCGAIPIVEEGCPVYEGFRYLRMDEPETSRRWEEAIAVHNFELCRERLTVDADALRLEVENMLRGVGSR